MKSVALIVRSLCEACIYAVVALVVLAMLLLGGCTDAVGSRLNQDIGTVATGNASPNTATQVDADGSWNATSPAGIAQTQVEDGRISVQTTSTSTELVSPLPGGVPFAMRSGKDVVITADSIKFSDGTELRKLNLSTSASAPIKAQGELYEQLVPLWTSMSADQKEQIIQTTNAIVEGAGDAFAKALEAAVKAFVPVP